MAVTTNLPDTDAFDKWYSTAISHTVNTISSRTPVKHDIFHMSENGTIYFGDTPLSHRHVELLDRLLRQEFPEEFI